MPVSVLVEATAMPRKPRRLQWSEAACYHLINRGHNRETVFATDGDRRYFLALLQRYRQRFGFRLYHYCLMSNHFHLLVQFRQPRQLSSCLAGILRSYVHYYNRHYGFVGHLWQGRFKSPAVEMESYLLSCGRYIERNPLAAGLVSLPWDHAWSSCRAYALGEANALPTLNPYYEELGTEPARRQQRWQEFLLGDDAKEEAIRRQDWLLGEAAFRGRTQQSHGRALGRLGRPRQCETGTLQHKVNDKQG